MFPIFRPAYKLNSSLLGRASGLTETLGAYQAWHERAIAIWIKSDEGCYVMRTVESQEHSWKKEPDAHFDNSEQEKNWRFYDDAKLRTEFAALGLPSNRNAPWSGLARHWLKDPAYWKERIGWRESHCSLDPNLIFFQKFQNGVMIGPARVNSTNNSEGEIFILVNDRPWQSVLVQSKNISVCGVPWTSPGGVTTIE